MHTSIKSLLFSGLVLATSTAAHAARGGNNASSAAVEVSVVCSCDDATGQQYGSAVRDLLRHDTHFREVSETEAERGDAIQIHIISQSLAATEGTGGEAISVVYTHDGAFLHQFINMTCANMPVGDSAQSVIKQIRDMEKDVAEMASAPEPPRVHKL